MEQQKLIELQGRLEKAKEVFKEMKATMAEKDAKIQELETEKQKWETMWNEDTTKLTHLLNDTTTKLQNTEEETKMLRETVENMRFDLTKANGERDRIKLDYDKLNETATPVLAMNTELTTQNSTLKSEVIELRNSNEVLVVEKERLAGELDKAQEYVNKKEVQFENLQKAFNDERANVLTLNGNIKELEDRLSNAQEDINDQANYITKLSESNKEKDQTISSLESRIKILTDELSKAQQDKTAFKETVSKHVTAVKKAMQGLNDGLGDEFNIFG